MAQHFGQFEAIKYSFFSFLKFFFMPSNLGLPKFFILWDHIQSVQLITHIQIVYIVKFLFRTRGGAAITFMKKSDFYEEMFLHVIPVCIIVPCKCST